MKAAARVKARRAPLRGGRTCVSGVEEATPASSRVRPESAPPRSGRPRVPAVEEPTLAAAGVKVRRVPLGDGRLWVQGVEASWDGGQWVALVCHRGTVGCGAFDLVLMEAHRQVLAIARGTPEKHLVTCEDLLEARVWGATRPARRLGVRKGMTCRQAAKLLS